MTQDEKKLADLEAVHLGIATELIGWLKINTDKVICEKYKDASIYDAQCFIAELYTKRKLAKLAYCEKTKCHELVARFQAMIDCYSNVGGFLGEGTAFARREIKQ